MHATNASRSSIRGRFVTCHVKVIESQHLGDTDVWDLTRREIYYIQYCCDVYFDHHVEAFSWSNDAIRRSRSDFAWHLSSEPALAGRSLAMQTVR
jgi:hypothetical protein